MSEYGVIFLIGLLGSAHCIGMCGGFVVALSQTHERALPLHIHQALYFLGKTVTYTILGAVVGGFGAVLGTVAAGLQDALSIAVGLFLVVIGLGIAGVLRRVGGPRWAARLGVVTRALTFFVRRRSPAGSFGLGLVNGLLPCGLVYGLLVHAATTGSSVAGALSLFVFGIATIPALYATALGSFLLRPVWRARLNVASGVLIILLGLATIVRGTPALDGLLHAGHASAIETHDAGGHDAEGHEAGTHDAGTHEAGTHDAATHAP